MMSKVMNLICNEVKNFIKIFMIFLIFIRQILSFEKFSVIHNNHYSYSFYVFIFGISLHLLTRLGWQPEFIIFLTF